MFVLGFLVLNLAPSVLTYKLSVLVWSNDQSFLLNCIFTTCNVNPMRAGTGSGNIRAPKSRSDQQLLEPLPSLSHHHRWSNSTYMHLTV